MTTDRPPNKAEVGTVWNDPKTPGLHLRFGVRSAVWRLFYRTRAGKQRVLKLGDTGSLNLTLARDRAQAVRREVAEGKDPAGTFQSLAGRPNLTKLADWHVDRHCKVKLKPRGAAEARRVWDRDVLPVLKGDTAVADVTEAAIADLHHKMRDRPIHANRVAAMLSKAFALAEGWHWRPRNSNPVQVQHYPENKRKRYPIGDEPLRLMKALEAEREANPVFVSMVLIIALSGARAGEIRTAKRAWVQPAGLVLPDSKTGSKTVPLSTFARDEIATLPVIDGNPYLIPGSKPGGCLVGYAKMWARVLKAAGIEDLNVHDMRRFFASAGLSVGESLSAIGRVLGHGQAQTTMRYAFLMTDAANATSEAASAAVYDLMVRTVAKSTD